MHHDHECGCGCGHDHEHEEPTVTLTLEDDTEIICDVIAIFPAGDKQYIALLPQDSDDGEVFLYRFVELENDEVDLQNIEDDEEYEIVADAFDELLDEEEFNEME
ncbi:MAG: DUF1292 domain-containing protein [Lachnospiraceae bacterium]